MTKPTARQIELFASWTDEQLQTNWDTIGTTPANLIQSGHRKGLLKISAIKRSDVILAEIIRRRRAAEARQASIDSIAQVRAQNLSSDAQLLGALFRAR